MLIIDQQFLHSYLRDYEELHTGILSYPPPP